MADSALDSRDEPTSRRLEQAKRDSRSQASREEFDDRLTGEQHAEHEGHDEGHRRRICLSTCSRLALEASKPLGMTLRGFVM
jgi:hypothetical protein